MEKLPVETKMLLKNLWRSLKTLWIERDLFPNKYSIVTRRASSGGEKMAKRAYITREEKASFYGICLTFQAVISLHYTSHFYFG